MRNKSIFILTFLTVTLALLNFFGSICASKLEEDLPSISNAKRAATEKVIDIGDFEFRVENKKGIRVAVFNLRRQRFEYIGFHASQEQSEEMRIIPRLDNDSYKFSLNGDIYLPAEPYCNYIFRTKYKIFLDDKDAGGKIYPSSIKTKDGEEIYKFLRNFGNNKNEGMETFTCTFQDESDERGGPFSELIKTQAKNDDSKNANRQERGKLGELGTELTMISFGYKRSEPKTEKEKGFDGVWIDQSESPSFLFLSESKCHEQDKSAIAFMDEELSYEAINRKLEKNTPPETKKLIINFISEKPDKIFRLLHRLKKSGEYECCMEKFNLYHYHLSTSFKELSPLSSSQQKSLAIRMLAEQIGASPQDMMGLMFASVVWGNAPANPQMSFGNNQTINDAQDTVNETKKRKVDSSLKEEETMEIEEDFKLEPLETYSDEAAKLKVKFLVQLINNDPANNSGIKHLKHRMIILRTLANYLRLSTPHKVLNESILEEKAKPQTLEKVWLALIKNLDAICNEWEIDKEALLSAYREKFRPNGSVAALKDQKG